jgi:fatty acid CoA ligase FadD9
MLPHRLFREQINADDTFIRLLYSVVMTGLAPFSFYVLDPDMSRSRAHYDGLPVDFVAAAIAGIGAEPHEGVRIYNVINHADDGVSLDVFVDWIEAAGYPVERVCDYDCWMARFEAKLRALPEHKRQSSSLHVLESLRQPKLAGRAEAGSRYFDHALRTLEIGPETPHLTQAYIEKCLDDMRRLGLIPLPDRGQVAAESSRGSAVVPSSADLHAKPHGVGSATDGGYRWGGIGWRSRSDIRG